MSKLLYSLGLVMLLHAGYSAKTHLSFLKSVGTAEDLLPLDILLELALSLVFCCIALTGISGSFQPVLLKEELSKKCMPSVHPGFIRFDHVRSRHLL